MGRRSGSSLRSGAIEARNSAPSRSRGYQAFSATNLWTSARDHPLPAIVVRDLVAMRRVRALRLADDDGLVRPLYRLELANRPRSPALQAFVELVESPG